MVVFCENMGYAVVVKFNNHLILQAGDFQVFSLQGVFAFRVLPKAGGRVHECANWRYAAETAIERPNH